jgi:hypothetical protein
MRHRKFFCGAPETMRHKNNLFLWRTTEQCATEIMWSPHPATTNYLCRYFCGAQGVVRHKNKCSCGALVLLRHRNSAFNIKL